MIILFVDDAVPITAIIKSRKLGFYVVAAGRGEDGEEALNELRKGEHFDFATVCFAFPQGVDFEFVRTMRQIQPDLRIYGHFNHWTGHREFIESLGFSADVIGLDGFIDGGLRELVSIIREE